MCLAGPDPASHAIKRIEAQCVVLERISMRLRVKARNDTYLFLYVISLQTTAIETLTSSSPLPVG